MLINIILGLSIMAVCLLLEVCLIINALKHYRRNEGKIQNPKYFSGMRVIGSIMLILVIGNIAQIGIWASLFMFLGEFTNFSAAFYHSAVNFSTLGYGDIVMSDQHRLLGPLEAVNGVLMIGVSTAALMAIFQDAFKKTFTNLE